MKDCDLLKAYAETKSEEAFAELVRKHIDLVFSAALRQVGGDVHLAQDVTQSVFNDLARKAGSLSARVILGGWLYTSARYAAARIVRTEQRRRLRERESQFMNEPFTNDVPPDWEQLQTALDEAMHDLKEADRNAIVLRYFQGSSFEDVGQKIGASADGARMRVDRAIEKLRKSLAKRGVVSTGAALAFLLAEESVIAAPVGLAGVVSSSAMGAAATTGISTTIIQFMAMTKLQAGVVAVAVAALTVPLVLQHQSNQRLERSNQVLAQRNSEIEGEIAPLKQEIGRLNGLVTQNAAKANPSNEVFQLRGEVARLREEARQAKASAVTDPTKDENATMRTLRSLSAKAEQLKKRLAETPESQIPELAVLTEKDWLDVVAYVEAFENDDDYRRALSSLRGQAKLRAALQIQDAVRKFAAVNGDMIPTEVSQVAPYLEKPLDEAILQRFQIVAAGKLSELSEQKDLIAETGPIVDQEFETTITTRQKGSTMRSFSAVDDTIEDAAARFAEVNNGILPRTVSDLAGMLPANVAADRIEKFLTKIPSNVTTLAQYRKAGHR
jgi:RNA polymerase sigma factor (sigma-70 family)